MKRIAPFDDQINALIHKTPPKRGFCAYACQQMRHMRRSSCRLEAMTKVARTFGAESPNTTMTMPRLTFARVQRVRQVGALSARARWCHFDYTQIVVDLSAGSPYL